ncbi:MAG: cobyric acid synthase CobQ, partial [Halioglobus sp.]
RLHPGVQLDYIGPGQSVPPADLVILPGSKNVRRDLRWLHDNGWPEAIARHLRYGGKVLGICGGYQMLGRTVSDPTGVEESPGTSEGLGYLEMDTEISPEKALMQVRGTLTLEDARVSGYEIHCGESRGSALKHPFAQLDDGRSDGARSTDGQVMGTYLHGVFDQPTARDALLAWAGLPGTVAADAEAPSLEQVREQQLDRLAAVIETEMDCEALFGLAGRGVA